MRSTWRPGLILAALCALASPALADLSKAEMGRILKDVETHLEASNMPALGESLGELAADDSSKVVKLIIKVLDKVDGDPFAVEGARKGLASQSDARALKEQRKSADKAKAWQVRAMLLALCAERGTDEDIDALIDGIKDKNAIVATNAIRKLCEDRVDRAVEPMIDVMEKLDRSQEPPWSELKFSLGELLGRKLSAGADFRSHWTVLKGQGGLSAVSDADREAYRGDLERDTTGDAGGGTVVRLFGTEIACQRIVFILDVSGSMRTIDPSDGMGPIGSAPRGEPTEEMEDPRMRIARAKAELKRVLKALPERTHINIIAYSTSVSLWKLEGLHALNDKNRSEAMSFVDDFKAYGVTATDAALRAAFKVEGARCFYLLSDGKPSMGEGADIPFNSIYDLVEQENKLLKVRIFTLGFKGADATFMRELARRTGGTYADIK